MPNLYFITFEIGAYAVAALCLVHAFRRCPLAFMGLLGAMTYGVLLEYAAILLYEAYEYGTFLVMLGRVPLCIGVSWGAIIYVAMETSDRLELPFASRPVLDALLALNIDLSMDAVAIRLGFWNWNRNGSWFGVPVGNFFGWFCIVLCFSLFWRLVRRRRPGAGYAGAGVLALGTMAASVVVVMLLLKIYIIVRDAGVPSVVLTPGIIGGSLLAALPFLLRSRVVRRPDLTLFVVPLFFHLYFLTAILLAGIYVKLPALLAVSLVMAALSLPAHLWPLRRKTPPV